MRRKPRALTGLKLALEDLSPEQQAAFYRMLDEQITYEEMVRRCRQEFGIKTSETAIGKIYKEKDLRVWLSHPGEETTIRLSRFELLISCPRPGVVGIVVKELAPKILTGQTPADASELSNPSSSDFE